MALMKRDGCPAAVRVMKLLVASALPNFNEAKPQ